MIEITKKISNAQGLHARPAANFVTLAKKFKSDIALKKDDKTVNGKSLLSVLSATITSGSIITLVFDGEDEEDAAIEISEFIDSGCGE